MLYGNLHKFMRVCVGSIRIGVQSIALHDHAGGGCLPDSGNTFKFFTGDDNLHFFAGIIEKLVLVSRENINGITGYLNKDQDSTT